MSSIRPCPVCHAPIVHDRGYMDHVLMEEDYFCRECNCGYEYAYGYSTVYIDGVEYHHSHTERATMADFREEHDAYRRARHRAMAEKLAEWNLSRKA